MRFLVTTTLFLFLAQAVAAAGPATISCQYDSYSNIEGNFPVKKEFRLVFVFDREKESVHMPDRLGQSELRYVPTRHGLSFIETLRNGNVMVTTIDRANNSVHSRNNVVNGVLAPSQFYGKCQILETQP